MKLSLTKRRMWIRYGIISLFSAVVGCGISYIFATVSSSETITAINRIITDNAPTTEPDRANYFREVADGLDQAAATLTTAAVETRKSAGGDVGASAPLYGAFTGKLYNSNDFSPRPGNCASPLPIIGNPCDHNSTPACLSGTQVIECKDTRNPASLVDPTCPAFDKVRGVSSIPTECNTKPDTRAKTLTSGRCPSGRQYLDGPCRPCIAATSEEYVDKVTDAGGTYYTCKPRPPACPAGSHMELLNCVANDTRAYNTNTTCTIGTNGRLIPQNYHYHFYNVLSWTIINAGGYYGGAGGTALGGELVGVDKDSLNDVPLYCPAGVTNGAVAPSRTSGCRLPPREPETGIRPQPNDVTSWYIYLSDLPNSCADICRAAGSGFKIYPPGLDGNFFCAKQVGGGTMTYAPPSTTSTSVSTLQTIANDTKCIQFGTGSSTKYAIKYSLYNNPRSGLRLDNRSGGYYSEGSFQGYVSSLTTWFDEIKVPTNRSETPKAYAVFANAGIINGSGTCPNEPAANQ